MADLRTFRPHRRRPCLSPSCCPSTIRIWCCEPVMALRPRGQTGLEAKILPSVSSIWPRPDLLLTWPQQCAIQCKTSCAGSCTICPRPCTPHAAAQLQPIHALRLRRQARLAPCIFMIDRLWLWCRPYKSCSDLNSQPKRPGDLDLLTLKVVSESRVTWATSVPIFVFLGLSVLKLRSMYATNRRQTDKRQTKASLNAPAY